MNLVFNDLINLVNVVTENKSIFAENYDLALDDLKLKADLSPHICQIVDFEKYAQIYLNPIAADYLNTSNEELNKLGFKYVFKYLHPENLSIIQTHIAYFSSPKNYNKVLSHLYYVNTKNGWRWLYNCTKVATFTSTGKAKYLFVKGTDISEILEEKNSFKKFKKNLSFIEENAIFFRHLSLREREILKLIVEEKSSIEIGKILNISHATVDTHRNNIIQKLHVKSSVGLVKFAIMFEIF